MPLTGQLAAAASRPVAPQTRAWKIGDQLFGEYTVPQIPFWVTITGGTGRFTGASGGFFWSVRFWGEVGPNGMPVNPWHFEGHLEGTISY